MSHRNFQFPSGATFPGVYATGPTLEAFDLPAVEAELGRAPAIVFWGTNDPVSTEQDVYDLEAQYGGPMEVVEMENGGHSSFLEPDRDVFWAETFDFLAQDDHPGFDACGPRE